MSEIVIGRAVAEELVGRAQRYERLALELRRRLEDEQHLLTVALAQLAAERGANDQQYFARRWLREHRNA